MNRLYLTEFPNPSAQLLVTDGGTRPRFSRDSRELFYLKGSTDERGQPKGLFMAATVTVNPTVRIGAPVQLFVDSGTDGHASMGTTSRPTAGAFS